MRSDLLNLKSCFNRIFDINKPWYAQVKKFCALNGFFNFSYLKADLAEYLAEECRDIPKTILMLVDLIKDIRNKYPVKHPDDVELPQVFGLTYFPKDK